MIAVMGINRTLSHRHCKPSLPCKPQANNLSLILVECTVLQCILTHKLYDIWSPIFVQKVRCHIPLPLNHLTTDWKAM